VILDLTERHDLFPGPIADTVGGSKIAGNVGFSCCVCTIQWFGCRFGIPFAMVGHSETIHWALIRVNEVLNSQTRYTIRSMYSNTHSVEELCELCFMTRASLLVDCRIMGPLFRTMLPLCNIAVVALGYQNVQ
jgi:hypothetical protein